MNKISIGFSLLLLISFGQFAYAEPKAKTLDEAAQADSAARSRWVQQMDNESASLKEFNKILARAEAALQADLREKKYAVLNKSIRALDLQIAERKSHPIEINLGLDKGKTPSSTADTSKTTTQLEAELSRMKLQELILKAQMELPANGDFNLFIYLTGSAGGKNFEFFQWRRKHPAWLV